MLCTSLSASSLQDVQWPRLGGVLVFVCWEKQISVGWGCSIVQHGFCWQKWKERSRNSRELCSYGNNSKRESWRHECGERYVLLAEMDKYFYKATHEEMFFVFLGLQKKYSHPYSIFCHFTTITFLCYNGIFLCLIDLHKLWCNCYVEGNSFFHICFRNSSHSYTLSPWATEPCFPRYVFLHMLKLPNTD